MRTRHTIKVLVLAASSRSYTTIKPPTVTLFSVRFSFRMPHSHAMSMFASLCFALLSVVGWVEWAGYHAKHVVIPSSFNFSPNFCRLLGRSVRHRTIHNGYWDKLSTVFGYGVRKVTIGHSTQW